MSTRDATLKNEPETSLILFMKATTHPSKHCASGKQPKGPMSHRCLTDVAQGIEFNRFYPHSPELKNKQNSVI